MLRIAIIGCGKIADQHVLATLRIADCEVVAACDRELLMAKQLAERFSIEGCFADAEEMLRVSKPDVVHITTPPQPHFALAKLCLEAGCHVYMEKPFTLTGEEAAELIAIAERSRRKLTAGHNYQFTPEMLAMRELIKQGFLGGAPIHLESYWPYDLSDASYAAPLISNRNHWVRRLPGQLFQNLISHGIAKLAEFLGSEVEVIARGSQSERLRSFGKSDILDELRVLLRDERGVTAFFSFSSQIKPGINELRVFGPGNSLVVDHASGSLLRLRNRSYKSYLTFFVPPLVHGVEHLRNAKSNVVNFFRRKLYQDAGMKELVERFYQSIETDGPPPIPYREILLTTRIMDEIFAQVYGPGPANHAADRGVPEARAGSAPVSTNGSAQGLVST